MTDQRSALIREALEQLIACHDEPTCPAIELGRQALASLGGEVQPVAHQSFEPYLSDRADGVRGHYAICRMNPGGYREAWNLHSHRWSSASEEVLTLEQATELLKRVAIPTAPQAPIQAPAEVALNVGFNAGPRDWPGDEKHENGSYMNNCCRCGQMFVGLKRRIVCKLCDEATRAVSEAADRFLGWPLPKTFAPDCGISFDGRKDDEWNKGRTWPVGTNLFTADEARQLFEHALAHPAAPVAQAPVAVAQGELIDHADLVDAVLQGYSDSRAKSDARRSIRVIRKALSAPPLPVEAPRAERQQGVERLRALWGAMRDRHYERMPDEVQIAYDAAGEYLHGLLPAQPQDSDRG